MCDTRLFLPLSDDILLSLLILIEPCGMNAVHAMDPLGVFCIWELDLGGVGIPYHSQLSVVSLASFALLMKLLGNKKEA